MILVEKAPKISHPLSKQEVDKYTKKWFEIKDTPEKDMPVTKKRIAYDELYDEVTTLVFKDLATTGHFEDIKKVMRQAWLKLGFEAGDGNNAAVNLANDMGNMTSNPTAEMIAYIIYNYNSIDDYLDGKDDENLLKMFKNFLVSRQDLWKSYTKDDITKIIRSIHKIITNSEDPKNELEEINKLTNLRDVLSKDPGEDNTIKVNKITDKSTEEDVTKVIRDSGVLNSKATATVAQKIINNFLDKQ